MFEGRCERQNMILRSLEVTGRKEQSAQRDEHISSPAPSPFSSKVWQSSSERRSNLSGIQRRRSDLSVHLERAHRQTLSELITGRDEFGALLDGKTTSSLVRLGDNNGEVLGSEEGWDGGFDSVEPVLVPLCRLGQVRECLSLPTRPSISDVESQETRRTHFAKRSAT